MDIIIEIGTPEDRTIIHQELLLLSSIVSKLDNLISISKIVVPTDFDAMINKLEGTTDYKSNRGVQAVARVVYLDDSNAIVLSPSIYTINYDLQTRLFISLHELRHAINRQLWPVISSESCSKGIYLRNLYFLFDEYVADRWALEIFDSLIQKKSSIWIQFIQDMASGFSSYINDYQCYKKIKLEIESFRFHGDVMLFMENIKQDFQNLAISIAHAFAISDNDSEILPLTDLMQSKFVNEKTINLMNLYKSKYKENDYRLHDDLDLIIDFVTNFGMKYEDTPQGYDCYVLDI